MTQRPLSDYYDPMDPGYPDRGTAQQVDDYLHKRRMEGKLAPHIAHALLNEYKDVITFVEETVKPDERVFVIRVTTSKPIPGLVDHIGGRVWALDGVVNTEVQEVLQ